MTVRNPLNLYHRRKRAATQTSNLFDCKQSISIGVRTLINAQMPLQCILYQPGTLHMACRAVADFDDVPSNRPMAELLIKSRYSGDCSGCNLRQIANALECFARQIAILGLDGLQKGNHRIAAAPVSGDYLIDKA